MVIKSGISQKEILYDHYILFQETLPNREVLTFQVKLNFINSAGGRSSVISSVGNLIIVNEMCMSDDSNFHIYF